VAFVAEETGLSTAVQHWQNLVLHKSKMHIALGGLHTDSAWFVRQVLPARKIYFNGKSTTWPNQ
jgi:hypothetical protein